jgi:hypothetical protein
MKRLFVLSLVVACMLISACGCGYNTNSSAYHSGRIPLIEPRLTGIGSIGLTRITTITMTEITARDGIDRYHAVLWLSVCLS